MKSNNNEYQQRISFKTTAVMTPGVIISEEEKKVVELDDPTIFCGGGGRRKYLRQSLGIIMGLVFNTQETMQVVNASAETPAEAVRQAAANNLPGYGPADLYYPDYFEGRWMVTRQVVFPPEEEKVLKYEIRFVPKDGAMVLDRGFSQSSYEAAIGNDVQDVKWVISNPNVLSLTYRDGSSKEIKVTKRSSELSKLDNNNNNSNDVMVSTSEFRRVTDVSITSNNSYSNMGIPSISANRVLSKWKVGDDISERSSSVRSIEGIELVYAFGTPADPMGGNFNGQLVGANAKPHIISKSRLRLERIQ